MGYMATALRLTADLWDYRSRHHDGLVLGRGSGSRIAKLKNGISFWVTGTTDLWISLMSLGEACPEL
jgi:hypothetical protein